MNTRTFCLTEAEAHALQVAYLHAQNAEAKIRFQAVRLYGLGYSVAQIQEICLCSLRSLLRWCHLYRTQGLTALLDARQGGNRARLRPDQIEAISHQLQTYTPAQLLGKTACLGEGQFWSVPELARLLERDYHLVYNSLTSYRRLLTECGLSYQRPAKQYKSRSESNIAEFEQLLEKNSWTAPNPLPTP